MPGRNFLFISGPTNVPRRIQNAMNLEQEDMRASDLPEFTKPLLRRHEDCSFIRFMVNL